MAKRIAVSMASAKSTSCTLIHEHPLLVLLAAQFYFVFLFSRSTRMKIEVRKNFSDFNIYLCCCFSQEAEYLDEWVNYYLALGFRHIFMFDNSKGDNGIDIVERLKKNNKITIFDKRNQKYKQASWYQDFYNTLGPKDWCLFCDIDEFLTIVNMTLLEYMKRVTETKCGQIKLSWMIYGNNGVIKKENGTVIERFPKPTMPLNFIKYGKVENTHTKPLVRGGDKMAKWGSVHHMKSRTMIGCDGDLKIVPNDSPFNQNPTWSTAYLRHYYTRSEQEFCYKIKKWSGKHSHHWDSYNSINKYEPNLMKTGKINDNCEYIDD